MSTVVPGYSSGATQTATNYNFLSTWDVIQVDKDPVLTYRYGSGRLTGLLELFGYKKPTGNLKYSHFEKDRVMPKIKATCSSGGAGAAVTFTLNAAANYSYDLNNSPYAGSANTTNSYPVRAGDLIMIKPASGTISYSTLIHAYVSSVNTSAGTFSATPLDSTDSIPTISTADEIVIYGSAHGEGSDRPVGLTTKASEYTNYIHTFKDTASFTDIGGAMKTWIEVDGKPYWVMEAERDAFTRIMNKRELTLLLNPGLSNATVSNALATAGTPMVMAKGLIQEILDRGNTTNYSALTGLTVADMEDLVVVLDKQKGSKDNAFFCGLDLHIQLDRELRDQFKNGAVTYGMFKMDEEKKVNLGFKAFNIGGYNFTLKTLDAFNDLQTLGASGFNFPKEGFILPADMTANAEDGKSVPSLRMRYLQKEGSKSMEMETFYYNGKQQGDSGTATEEVRYSSYTGIETFGLNRATYVKLA
jgi:hypothetical protein